MLYHFLYPLEEFFGALRVFQFITFRAAGAAATAILLTFVVAPPVIRVLRNRNVGQIIRADGPTSHQSKRGTPTMGGLIILLCTFVPTILWARLDNPYVIVAMIATLVDRYHRFSRRLPEDCAGQVTRSRGEIQTRWTDDLRDGARRVSAAVSSGTRFARQRHDAALSLSGCSSLCGRRCMCSSSRW